MTPIISFWLHVVSLATRATGLVTMVPETEISGGGTSGFRHRCLGRTLSELLRSPCL